MITTVPKEQNFEEQEGKEGGQEEGYEKESQTELAPAIYCWSLPSISAFLLAYVAFAAQAKAQDEEYLFYLKKFLTITNWSLPALPPEFREPD